MYIIFLSFDLLSLSVACYESFNEESRVLSDGSDGDNSMIDAVNPWVPTDPDAYVEIKFKSPGVYPTSVLIQAENAENRIMSFSISYISSNDPSNTYQQLTNGVDTVCHFIWNLINNNVQCKIVIMIQN